MIYETRIPFFLIWRFITRSNKWSLGLTIFLMAIAFINLIFVTSLFNGIIEGSNNQIIDTHVGHVQIEPAAEQETIADIDIMVEKIHQTDGVVGISAQTLVPATLKYENITTPRQIIAIDPVAEKSVTNIWDKLEEGEYLKSDDVNGIIIGRQIAGGPDVEQQATSFKDAAVGDQVTLLVNGFSKELTIRGIFNTKFINTDVRAFISRTMLDEIKPGWGDQATDIIIRIAKKGQEEEMIAALKANGVTGTFNTWEDSTGLIKSITKSFLSINVIMSFVGVLIAAATIIIIIYIDVTNKRRQIGILRAIGIKPYLIQATYVLQSAVYSVAGVLLGTGLFFAAIVPYFEAHPFELPICDATLFVQPADFIFRAELVMCVAVIAGLIPAMIVTRMKILNAILGKQ